jgi:hypothetical protein
MDGGHKNALSGRSLRSQLHYHFQRDFRTEDHISGKSSMMIRKNFQMTEPDPASESHSIILLKIGLQPPASESAPGLTSFG